MLATFLFAALRSRVPNSKSAQTHRKVILSDNQTSQQKDLRCNIELHTIYHVQFQEAKGLRALSRCHTSQDALAKMAPKWRIPTSSPWVGPDFARPHLPNSKSEQTNGKVALSENQRSHEKDLPCKIQSLPSARTHTIYHVQFQEVKGLPSNVPASHHWEPPASTLAHCLAVIHPKQDVLAKGCLACRRQSNAICKLPARAPHPANGVRTEQLGSPQGDSRRPVHG